MGFDKHFKIYKENWQIIQVNLAALNKEINDEKHKLDYIAKDPTFKLFYAYIHRNIADLKIISTSIFSGCHSDLAKSPQ